MSLENMTLSVKVARAAGLLKHHGIGTISVKPSSRAADVIKDNVGRAEIEGK